MARVPALPIAVERPQRKFLFGSQFICRLTDFFKRAEDECDVVLVDEVVIDFFQFVSGNVSGRSGLGIIGARFSVEAPDEP